MVKHMRVLLLEFQIAHAPDFPIRVGGGGGGVSLNGPRFHLQTIAFEFINNGRSGYDNSIFKLDAQTRAFVVSSKRSA